MSAHRSSISDQASAILERGLARTTSPSWWFARMGSNPKHVAQSLMAEGR